MEEVVSGVADRGQVVVPCPHIRIIGHTPTSAVGFVMNRYTAVLFLFKNQEQIALAVGQEVGCNGREHWSFADESIVAGGGGFCNPPSVRFDDCPMPDAANLVRHSVAILP